MEHHPAAAIFPMMGEQAFAALVEDIRTNGQREPIVCWKDQILDGRNRLKACEQLNIEPDTCDLDDSVDPVAYVLSANLHRRHLDESQRGMVGGRIEKYYAAQAKDRQKKHGGTAPGKKKTVVENLPQVNGKARDKAAEAVSVSGKTVSHAKTVLEKGSPELIAAVDAGKVVVSRAAKIAKDTPKASQISEATKPRPRSTKSVFDHLCHWWGKADAKTKAKFRKYAEMPSDV